MDEWMYNPNQSYGLDSSAYNLGTSGNSYNTVSYTPATSGYDLGSGGGNFGNVTYTPPTSGYDFSTGGNYTSGGTSWWDTPSAPTTGGYTPGYDFSYQPNFTLGAGSSGAPTNAGSSFGGVTAGAGTGTQLAPGLGGLGTGSFATAPTTNNTGITGSFGMMDEPQYGVGNNAYSFAGQRLNGMPQPSAFDRGLDTAGQYASRAWDATGGAVGRGLSAVGEYAQQKPWAARFAVDAAGLGLNYMAQRDANKLAREQLQMQREAQAKNTALADRLNAEATQSLNEARSLYNPQEMGIRAMADTKAATNRAIAENTAAMRKSGMSQAAIDAETRRARLGGTTGAATAYTKGLDVGRQAQQSALTSAKGLSQQYGGTPDYSGAKMVSEAGRMTAQQAQNLLNTYLQNPVGRTELDMYRDVARRGENR